LEKMEGGGGGEAQGVANPKKPPPDLRLSLKVKAHFKRRRPGFTKWSVFKPNS
jgi:hypothetical protein